MLKLNVKSKKGEKWEITPRKPNFRGNDKSDFSRGNLVIWRQLKVRSD